MKDDTATLLWLVAGFVATIVLLAIQRAWFS